MPGVKRCRYHVGPAMAIRSHPKMDAELTDRLARLLRSGNYIEVATAVVGVSTQRFYEWIERGDPAGSDPADEPFRVFRAALAVARAEGEARLVDVVETEAETNWAAATWLLERGPARWDKPPTSAARKREAKKAKVEEPVAPDEFSDLDELAARRVA